MQGAIQVLGFTFTFTLPEQRTVLLMCSNGELCRQTNVYMVISQPYYGTRGVMPTDHTCWWTPSTTTMCLVKKDQNAFM